MKAKTWINICDSSAELIFSCISKYIKDIHIGSEIFLFWELQNMPYILLHPIYIFCKLAYHCDTFEFTVIKLNIITSK